MDGPDVVTAESIHHRGHQNIYCQWGVGLERSHVCVDEEIPECSLCRSTGCGSLKYARFLISLYIRIVCLVSTKFVNVITACWTFIFPEKIVAIEHSCGHWGVDGESSSSWCFIRIRCCPTGPGTQVTMQVRAKRENQRLPRGGWFGASGNLAWSLVKAISWRYSNDVTNFHEADTTLLYLHRDQTTLLWQHSFTMTTNLKYNFPWT